jgi:hypothetical protein
VIQVLLHLLIHHPVITQVLLHLAPLHLHLVSLILVTAVDHLHHVVIQVAVLMTANATASVIQN